MKNEQFHKKCGNILKKVLTHKMSIGKAVFLSKKPQLYLSILKNTVENIKTIEDIYSKLSKVNEKEKYETYIKIYQVLIKKYKNDDKFLKEVENLTKDFKFEKKRK